MNWGYGAVFDVGKGRKVLYRVNEDKLTGDYNIRKLL